MSQPILFLLFNINIKRVVHSFKIDVLFLTVIWYTYDGLIFFNLWGWGGGRIQFLKMWITRFIPRYFSRVCLLGRLNFEIISKYILLLLSTDNKKMQIIITIDNSWGGGGGQWREERLNRKRSRCFYFSIVVTAKYIPLCNVDIAEMARGSTVEK